MNDKNRWISVKDKPVPSDREVFIQIELGDFKVVCIGFVEIDNEIVERLFLKSAYGNAGEVIEANFDHYYVGGSWEYTPNLIKYWKEIEYPEPYFGDE